MAKRPSPQRGIRRGAFSEWPAHAESPDDVAAKVTYTGSRLHKTYPSPAGPPGARSDRSKCAYFSSDQWPRLLDALRTAIRAGSVGEFEKGEFPDRVWVWINDVLHEARLTNAINGDYHGFPIDDPRQYPAPASRLSNVPRIIIASN